MPHSKILFRSAAREKILSGATQLADAVNAHITAGGTVNPDCWLPCDTVYGSEAWDQEDELELARFN